MRHLVVAVPGDLGQLTGGYLYDRRAATALEERGWRVELRSLPELSTVPTAEELAAAAAAFAEIPDGTLALVDGLALGKLPQVVARHADRLRLAALVHHPLYLESGLTADEASFLRSSERAALARVRAVVCTSRATAETLAGELAVDRRRITVALPGVARAEAARGSGGGRTRLLYVATVTARKAHLVLVEALRQVSDLDWEMCCVGSLEREPATVLAMARKISAYGLSDRVMLAGELEGTALADLYGRADLFVSSSLYEGYGMALADALAHGLPVVAAAGGAVEQTVPASAGLLVPPGDASSLAAALRDVMENAALRARLREGALRARLELPAWSDTAAAIENALEKSC